MPRVFFNPFSGNIDMAPDSFTKSIPFREWFNDGSDPAPLEANEYNQKVFLFSEAAEQVIKGRIKVMSDYVAGQLILKLSIYTPATVGKCMFSLTSILHPVDGDISNNTLLQTVDTGEISVVSGIPNKIYKLELPLTDNIGKVNNVMVKGNDTIDFMLKRITLPTMTDVVDDIRVIPAAEVMKS